MSEKKIMKKILATYINEFNYKFIIAGANINNKIFKKFLIKKVVTYTKTKYKIKFRSLGTKRFYKYWKTIKYIRSII